MNRVLPREHLTPLEADYAQWCLEQAALLRNGMLNELDRENLAEEIEALGRKDKDQIESRLSVLLVHLLKWQFQPSKRKGGWKATLRNQRIRIGKLLKHSPSLKNYPAEILSEEYAVARLNAADETGLNIQTFPDTCPYSIAQILDIDFLPDA